jgi:hypothetical protein
MSSAYVIEVSHRTAGIVVAEGQGFRFFSSEPAFDTLEGGHFGSARAAERAAKAVLVARGQRSGRAYATG